MRLVLPKASRGFVFDKLFTVEMNDFDVERLLPSLFYVVVSRGRQRGARVNDPKAFDSYLESLLSHPRVVGFDDVAGRRLLERWIRTSVVRIGKAGRARREEQIEFVLPLTLLAYKTGFPAEIRRQRNVHLFLYRNLIELLTHLDAKPTPQAALGAYFTKAFGSGVTVGPAPRYDGSYDGSTPLDLQTLLSLCFLDGFQPSEASKREATEPFGPALPGVSRGFSRDLLHYIIAYGNRMPVLGLTRHLMALINFGMFVYTTKLAYATNSLLLTHELPLAMAMEDAPSPPELYVDFTRSRGSESDELARACVERDMEEMGVFLESAMWLRSVDRFMQFNVELKERFSGLSTPEYLQGLTRLQGDSVIEARAQAEVESILHETLAACDTDVEREDAKSLCDEIVRRCGGHSLEAAAAMLTAAQRKNALEGYMKWFWSTAGLRKSFGLMSGNLRGRRNWRYAMSDDLLAALVQLAMLEDPSGRLESVTSLPRLRLGDFLEILYRRYGILVDRPPAFLDNAQARAAARENHEALKRRLRQMGFFEALSDDFTAQYLRAPSLEVTA